MFSALLAQIENDLGEVKLIVEWQEKLRSTIYSTGAAPPPLAIAGPAVDTMRAQAPKKVPWQIFDHCAAISRIYALYEKAISDIVELYLSLLPKVFPNYADLAEKLRVQHRTGVGQILIKWSLTHPLFGGISEADIASGLADGLRAKPYGLLGDAFLLDPGNLRTSALLRLFNGLGFENCFGWVRKHKPVCDFCVAKLAGTDTADSFLDSFVRIRNEAAHGHIANIAGAGLLADYADFVLVVVDALASLLRTELVHAGIRSKSSVLVGEVLHTWSNNIAGVRSSCDERISVGDRLYGGKKVIEVLTVQSLRIHATDHPSLLLKNALEFGIRFDKPLSEGAIIYRWKG